MSTSILVTCATGRQGKATIRALLELSDPPVILAVTRSPSSPATQKLLGAYPSIKLVQGNLDDVPSIFSAAQKLTGQPITGVFSVQQAQGLVISNEEAQGKSLIDESLSRGVKHFVYSSAERGGNEKSWSNPTNVPHFITKHNVELYLRQKAKGSQMGWTILRPVAFMDNLEPGMQSRVFLASLQSSFSATKKMQWIATRDIGVFAAKAFADPEEFNGRAVGLAGDETTLAQLSQIFAAATTEGLKPTFTILGSALKLFVGELRLMINWISREGSDVDIPALKQVHPGLVDLKTWIVEESKFTAKK